MLLEGKTAVISGAAGSRGIGFATARLFAQHGARVAILDLDERRSREAAQSLGEGHIGEACDVTDHAACDAAARSVTARFGVVDILINNAGIMQPRGVLEVDDAGWNAVMDTNLHGVLYLSQAFIPQMQARKQGVVACTASIAGQTGSLLGGPHYSASKAGILGLAKSMAREFGPDGIRVNCVAPGWIETDLNAGKASPERMEDFRRQVPLRRLGRPEDVAGAFLFLTSELSGYITGAVIDVNGGVLIHG